MDTFQSYWHIGGRYIVGMRDARARHCPSRPCTEALFFHSACHVGLFRKRDRYLDLTLSLRDIVEFRIEDIEER